MATTTEQFAGFFKGFQPGNEQFAGLFKGFQPGNEQFTTAFKAMFPGMDAGAGFAANPFPGNDQLMTAMRAGLEAQFSLFNTLTTAAVESAEKVASLNMNAAKASVEESSVIAKQLLASKDTQEFLSLIAALPQPTAAKAVAYNRHLAEIASSAQAEFARATQEQFEETSRKFSALVDEAARNAPAGSENALAIMKTAIRNASGSYEQFARSSKQAAETMQANVNAAVDQATQAVEQTAATASRSRK
jgi:phasin family protein